MSANSVTTVKRNADAVAESAAYVADSGHMEIYNEVKAIDAQIEALKLARAELIKPVRQDMEVLEVPKIVGVDNSTLFTLSTSTRRTLDSKKIREDHPEIAENYTNETEVTTFKVM